MTIGRLYHVIHVVEDLAAAEHLYGTVFPYETYTYREWSDHDRRVASLSVLAENFVIELIEPSRADEDQHLALPKFGRRFGSHLHSIAWFADDVPALGDRLSAAGVRVLGGQYGTIFTHPKDTFGQLQFQTGPPDVPVPDPRLVAGWSLSPANREHPLGLVRASHVTTMVTDLEAAVKLYLGPLDGQLLRQADNADAHRAFVFVGTDTVVELAQPVETGTALYDDLERNGQLPHSVTFLVRDLGAAHAHLDAVGVAAVEVDGGTLLLDPSATLGARLLLTDAALPGDPR